MENKEIRFDDDGSGYGTHLRALRLMFRCFHINKVLEFGMGKFSTLFFLHKGCEVTSVEMQDKDWFDFMTNHIGENDLWKGMLNLNPHCYKEFTEEVDLAFVDGHLLTRPECVNQMFGKAKIIVAHDFECNVYGWERIRKPDDYHQIDFRTNGSLITCIFLKEELI